MSKETRKKTTKPASAARSPTTTRTKTKATTKAAAGAKAGVSRTPKRSASRSVPDTQSARRTAAAPKAAEKAATAKKATAKTVAAPAPKGGVLVEGQAAPDFELPRDGGQRLSLRDYAGRNLVLFFYPRADTPGCTREAMDFSRLAGAFAAAGTDVVGVSGDSVKAQDSFKNKHKLETPLASDEKKEMLAAYGAWGEKSLYGRRFLGILRTTVLIDGEGKIIRIWRNVKVDGHADAVLEAVRSL